MLLFFPMNTWNIYLYIIEKDISTFSTENNNNVCAKLQSQSMCNKYSNNKKTCTARLTPENRFIAVILFFFSTSLYTLPINSHIPHELNSIFILKFLPTTVIINSWQTLQFLLGLVKYKLTVLGSSTENKEFWRYTRQCHRTISGKIN